MKYYDKEFKFPQPNQSGFFDLDDDWLECCRHPDHDMPMFIYIPAGKGYRHVCPACGKITTVFSPRIFW